VLRQAVVHMLAATTHYHWREQQVLQHVLLCNDECETVMNVHTVNANVT